MPKQTRTYKAILSEVARGNRSTLFCWLVNHHDDLIEQAAGKPMRWEPLCKRFAEHGLTDINGQPATPSTARATWFQVRKAVAEAKKRKKASDAARRPGDVYPSRISPDWRPTVVPPPPIRAAPAAAGTTFPPPSNDPRAPSRDPDMTPEGQAVLDNIWADLLAEDRKKFGF
jgi:hypothetical protein